MKYIFTFISLILFVACNEDPVKSTTQLIDGQVKIENVEDDQYFLSFTNKSSQAVVLPATQPDKAAVKVEYFSDVGWVMDPSTYMLKSKVRVMPQETIKISQKLQKLEGRKYRFILFFQEEDSKLKFKSILDL
jgi:uncharacterized protein YcfL